MGDEQPPEDDLLEYYVFQLKFWLVYFVFPIIQFCLFLYLMRIVFDFMFPRPAPAPAPAPAPTRGRAKTKCPKKDK